MDDKIQLENGLELWKVEIDELREQDKNARTMPDAMFRRLTDTIKRDSRMESLPFCAVTDKGIEVISGHHRTRAARSAGVNEVWVIVDTTGLTPSQIKSKQLAHNAISGSDDPSMLSQIFAELETVEDIKESFIFKDDFDNLEKMGMSGIQLDIATHSMLLLFVPSYYEKWESLLNNLPSTDEIAVADATIEEQFRVAVKTTGKAYNIKAATPIICKMIDIITQDTESRDGWEYISDIFGPRVPETVGTILKLVLAKMEEAGDITKKNKWQALEYLAAEYLGK